MTKFDVPSVLWNMPQTITDPQQAQGRNNIGAAALASLAASFESRAPSYNWSANEVCTYGGKLWMFDANHSGPWTGADAHETNLMEVLAMATEKPTSIVSGPIMKDNTLTGKELYTYTNNARTASVTLSQDYNMFFLLKSGPLANVTTQQTFKPNTNLKIKRARLVTPGSEGVASANGYNAAIIYFTPYDYSNTGSVYGLTITKYNEWEDVNIDVDGSDMASDYTLKLYSAYNDNGNTRATELRVDDYNLQSAYEGQKLQAWLELEVETDGLM